MASARQFLYSASNDTISASSTDYVTRTSITFTPDANTDYLIIGMCQMYMLNSSNSGKIRLYDGTNTLLECINTAYADYDYEILGGSYILSSGASPSSTTIYFQHARIGLGIYTREVRLLILKLDSTYDKWTYDSTRSTWNTNTTHQDKVSKQFDLGASGDYLIIGSCVYDASSTSYDTEINIDINGSQYGLSNHAPISTVCRNSYLWFKKVSLSSGSNTIKLQYATENTSGTAGCAYALIAALKLDEFLDYKYAEQTTEQSTSGYSSYTTTLSLDASSWPETLYDYLILGCWLQRFTLVSTANGPVWQVSYGAASSMTGVHACNDNTNYHPHWFMEVSIPSDSDDQNSTTNTLAHRSYASGGTTYSDELGLCIIRLDDHGLIGSSTPTSTVTPVLTNPFSGLTAHQDADDIHVEW